MEPPDKRFSELVGIVKSWIPRRSEPSNVSRDFWMPDKSCRVCYECDLQFTVFNRRHHCRLCGRVFCAKCTLNSVLVSSGDANNVGEVRERIRVCNYCFKRWEQELVAADNDTQLSRPVLSPSVSTASLVSTKSSGTGDSSTTAASILYSTGVYSHAPYCSDPIGGELIQMEPNTDKLDSLMHTMDLAVELGDASPNQFGFCSNRSDDDDDEYDSCRFDSETQCLQTSNEYYGQVDFDEFYQDYQANKISPADENTNVQQICSSVPINTELHTSFNVDKMGGEHNNSYKLNASSTIYGMDGSDTETVDFENNNQLWQPPEPEDEEDEREPTLFDDDDDDATGEWGYLRSSNSFGSGEYRSRDRSSEEHKKAMKNVVDGHFRALIAQLLQVENLSVGEENNKVSWLEIITSLSWEAATLLKPDTSKGGGMDPGGYVKVKCIASGSRCDSMVVKGVVCKKNVAHRRMSAKIEKPRFLILGGALEYQRVTNTLSSVDTLLQQEMDHLKMAVAKIVAHHPNVLLVEKSVSRFAQDYLLAKNISLVLNIKKALLERIARCTGAQIVPSIDHLSSQKLGYCDLFHVEKYFEEHGRAGQAGKKLMKTLMFFEGCPKPLGCTILLKGANGDELKKVKHVVQYGVFAAYHLALETSFLADEGASLPELPLKSPITVALPDKPSTISRSISTFPSFSNQASSSPQVQNSVPGPDKLDLTLTSGNSKNMEMIVSPGSSEGYNSKRFPMEEKHTECEQESTVTSSYCAREDENNNGFVENLSTGNKDQTVDKNYVHEGNKQIMERQPASSDLGISHQENYRGDDNELSREDLSTSDHQSILVSLSSRCIWKGTVCERAHLFRIKYYGSFDKPLGRFLRDNLFDESSRCRSCELPPEAHVHCYTHRQGSLTISVRKQEVVLPGERDGKIWMWHRCLRCPRINGFPPATRRVVMSDAAWGLSFGKFLELSFSNNAAASRVASCGHSLHRDCLRFYGFGKTVACFRYASVNLHSVYLPPSKLDFNYQHQEWIQKEADEVAKKAELLFTEILIKLHQIAESRMNNTSFNDTVEVSESIRIAADLEGILQKEKDEFKESLQKVTKKEPRKGQPVIDILEINKLRRQLLFQSYFWDQRLICAANSYHNQVIGSIITKSKGSTNKLADLNLSPKPLKGFLSLDAIPSHSINDELMVQDKEDVERDPSHIKQSKASSISASNQLDQMEFGSVVRRVHSEGQFLAMADLSDTFDARWIGENGPNLAEASVSNWIEVPFSNLYRSINKDDNAPKVDALNEYKPVYVSLFRELERQGGARLLLPIGVNDIVIPVYDDEPTSIISYALVSSDYNSQMLDDRDKTKDSRDSSLQCVDDTSLESLRTIGLTDDSLLSLSGSKSSLILDPLARTKALHPRVSFSGDGSFGKVKYTVTCYFAKHFEALQRTCCPSELDFIRSLSRCKKWGAQGGKSNVFFAKSLDDRFIIKQVTKTELESFITFAPEYFKYLSESISTGCPTCLAKILGIYQITTKNMKGGKETRMDVLVMENLLFGRTVTKLYDLKGSSRSRYNPDSSGQNKVLLDQNLIEAMPTSPIFLGNKAKRLLERAVWNDTAFLASIDVMDYSLLVGIDEEKHELVLGIIDFMRQYTWDKHLETWVKASGILGGPKNESPTVISPKQYKKRFRKAMSAYFLVVPDQWSPPTIIPSRSQSELSENAQLALNQSSNQS